LRISLKEAELTPAERDYGKSDIPVAVLLEGIFPSAFKNRMVDHEIKTQSRETKMIVVADGDIIRNDVQRSGTSEGFFPLSKDRYTGEMVGNRDFLVNCVNFLVDDNGLMVLRSREVKMRLLDKSGIKAGKAVWQIVNVIVPVLLVVMAGVIYGFFRKRKYTRF
jgi:ABC-2 type transport system permease protein